MRAVVADLVPGAGAKWSSWWRRRRRSLRRAAPASSARCRTQSHCCLRTCTTTAPSVSRWVEWMLAQNLQNHPKLTNKLTNVKYASASKLACGVRTAEEPRAWSTKACEVRVPEPSHVACRCRGLGTYALFTVARSTLVSTNTYINANLSFI